MSTQCECPPGMHPYSAGCIQSEHVGANVTPEQLRHLQDCLVNTSARNRTLAKKKQRVQRYARRLEKALKDGWTWGQFRYAEEHMRDDDD